MIKLLIFKDIFLKKKKIGKLSFAFRSLALFVKRPLIHRIIPDYITILL